MHNGFFWLLIFRWLPTLTNEIFAYNIIILLSFILAALIAYLVCYEITHNRIASFISGLIFGFCPYHFQRAWEHFSLAQIQWPALFCFSLILFFKNQDWKRALLIIIASTLILQFDFNYTFVVLVFTFLFLFFIAFHSLATFQRNSKNGMSFFKKVITQGHIVKQLILIVLVLILLNVHYILSVIKSVVIAPQSTFSAADFAVKPMKYLFSQSANLLNYIIPSSANPLLGGLARSLEGSIFYGRGPIEQTLYLGWVPILLAWFAGRNCRRKAQDDSFCFHWRLLVFIAIGAFLFSLPPYVNLGIIKIYFPSFLMYKILPMFRAYARFGLLVMLAVSILAGMGMCNLLKKVTNKKRACLLIGFLSCLILVEFNNVPPFRFAKVNNPPAVYKWLAQQKGDFVIVEYPIRLGDQLEGYVDLDYLMYQRYHQKMLINGAKPHTQAFEVKKRILKIMDSNTIDILKKFDVKYIIIHEEKYRQGNNQEAVEIVGAVPDVAQLKELKLMKKFGDDLVFALVANHDDER